MCTVWHVDKYKITFKLVPNSRRISRGPVNWCQGPVPGWETLVWREREKRMLSVNCSRCVEKQKKISWSLNVVCGRLTAELENWTNYRRNWRTEQTINGIVNFLFASNGVYKNSHGCQFTTCDVIAWRLHLHTSVWLRGPSVSAVRCDRQLCILWTQKRRITTLQ